MSVSFSFRECLSRLVMHVENSLGTSCLKSMSFWSRWRQVKESLLPWKMGFCPKCLCTSVSVQTSVWFLFPQVFDENTEVGTRPQLSQKKKKISNSFWKLKILVENWNSWVVSFSSAKGKFCKKSIFPAKKCELCCFSSSCSMSSCRQKRNVACALGARGIWWTRADCYTSERC